MKRSLAERTSRRRPAAITAVLVALAGVLAWIVLGWSRPSSQDEPRTPPASASAAATLAPAPAMTAPPSSAPPTAGTDADSSPAPAPGRPRPPDPETAASWSAAERTASAFMASFARPPSSHSAREWWRAVSSFLTDQARLDYEGVDPSTVPYTRVTGPAQVQSPQEPSDLVVFVQVPTDAGKYLVHLVPAGGAVAPGSPIQWKVSRLTPPAP